MPVESIQTEITSIPEQGQLVVVRQRSYVVISVSKSALASSTTLPLLPVAQHLLTLSSIEDDALGEELQVVWELEPGTSVQQSLSLPQPSGFDPPARLDAFLNAVRWGAASTADVRSIQSPFRSGIEIEDYQLDPVVRAIQMPRVNLLIADDVGLGKTIEAGMVLLELVLRHRARKALVVCPSSLQLQWRDQMRDKFGLEFRIVDSDLMRELRRTRGLHVNPWTHYPRLITSIDFLKRERPMRLFREILPTGDAPTYPRLFDLLILDEAHNVAPSGRGKYATDSLRTDAVRLLSPHFEHKLFLSATPHNGYRESFSALLELLDDQRFARGIDPDPKQLQAIMVRRLKSELPPKWDGSLRFPKRKLEPLEVAYTLEESRVHALLQRYTQLRKANAEGQEQQYVTEFVLKLLKKRLFSSPAAFGSTLAQHEKSLRSGKRFAVQPSIVVLQRTLDRADEEYSDDAEKEDNTQEAIEAATSLTKSASKEELQILNEMKAWAHTASAAGDSKLRAFISWIKEIVRPNGTWTNERVIVFTEYRATQKWLQTFLASEGLAGGDRLMTLYGGMDPAERESIKAAFQYDPVHSPVRILLATDAASEGIDLQNHCHRLLHFEIPWNPNRMEQRNGRVDRHGQRAKTVDVYHFVGKGYKKAVSGVTTTVSDLEADLEFLMRAAIKVNTIREDLGKVGPVIAEQVEAAMLGGARILDTARAEKESEPIRKLMKFELDLKAQIAKHYDQLRETKKDLQLDPENIQAVVEIALALAGQPPLIPTKLEGVWPSPNRTQCSVFHLPALKGSWARAAEGLFHPHTGEVRPIVFDHALANGRDDVVLAHMNHVLVQMSLRLLRAEVWSPAGKKKLNRVAAAIVPDDVLDSPAVFAHGRLVVIGGDSQRLHEEVIVSGGVLREGRFSRMNVGEVRDALGARTTQEPSQAVKTRLASLWGKSEAPVMQSLEARMKERTAGLEKLLSERAEKEVSDITAIMKELEKRISAELNNPENAQLVMEFNTMERDQFERNVHSLEARVRAIPAEIEKETAAIRKRFSSPQPRLFPVAVTFLVPAKLANG
jgi:SNF2 family DNA or RNA helicase